MRLRLLVHVLVVCYGRSLGLLVACVGLGIFEFGWKEVSIRWHGRLGGPIAFGLGAIFPGWEVGRHGSQSARDR